MMQGIRFPAMFDSGTKTTKKVSELEKVRSDVLLLLQTQILVPLFRPNFGIDGDRLLFVDSPDITRDLIFKTVSDALKNNVPNVEVEDVSVLIQETTCLVKIKFLYKEDGSEFETVAQMGG